MIKILSFMFKLYMMYYDSCFSIMEKMYKKIVNLINNVFQNYFELTLMFSALLVIIIAIAMDEFLYLQACALCVLTRYIFGLVAVSGLVGFLFKRDLISCLLYTSPSPRDKRQSRMPSSA